MEGRRRGERGIAMTIVVMTILLLTMIAGSVLTMGYNQRLLSRSVEAKMLAFYRAQAGLMDAQEQIRTLAAYNTPGYDPALYTVDVDGVAPFNDAAVDIGPESTVVGSPTYGIRPVVVIGRE